MINKPSGYIQNKRVACARELLQLNEARAVALQSEPDLKFRKNKKGEKEQIPIRRTKPFNESVLFLFFIRKEVC